MGQCLSCKSKQKNLGGDEGGADDLAGGRPGGANQGGSSGGPPAIKVDPPRQHHNGSPSKQGGTSSFPNNPSEYSQNDPPIPPDSSVQLNGEFTDLKTPNGGELDGKTPGSVDRTFYDNLNQQQQQQQQTVDINNVSPEIIESARGSSIMDGTKNKNGVTFDSYRSHSDKSTPNLGSSIGAPNSNSVEPIKSTEQRSVIGSTGTTGTIQPISARDSNSSNRTAFYSTNQNAAMSARGAASGDSKIGANFEPSASDDNNKIGANANKLWSSPWSHDSNAPKLTSILSYTDDTAPYVSKKSGGTVDPKAGTKVGTGTTFTTPFPGSIKTDGKQKFGTSIGTRPNQSTGSTEVHNVPQLGQHESTDTKINASSELGTRSTDLPSRIQAYSTDPNSGTRYTSTSIHSVSTKSSNWDTPNHNDSGTAPKTTTVDPTSTYVRHGTISTSTGNTGATSGTYQPANKEQQTVPSQNRFGTGTGTGTSTTTGTSTVTTTNTNDVTSTTSTSRTRILETAAKSLFSASELKPGREFPITVGKSTYRSSPVHAIGTPSDVTSSPLREPRLESMERVGLERAGVERVGLDRTNMEVEGGVNAGFRRHGGKSVTFSGPISKSAMNLQLPDRRTFRQQVLDAHNRFRSRHGVPPLRLSNKLTDQAQKWAEKGAKAGSLERQQQLGENNHPLGENFWTVSATGPTPVSGEYPVQTWYEESTYYDYNNPMFTGTNHFTQIVWKSSQEVGVGIAVTPDERHAYVVCNYFPTGNVEKAFTDNVLPLSR